MTGLAFDLVPTTLMLTLMTTIALTLIFRKRRRAGTLPLAGGSPAPLALPYNPVLRGLVIGIGLLLFEIGVNARPPEIRGFLNVIAYTTDYRDLQRSVLDINTAELITSNAVVTRTRGVHSGEGVFLTLTPCHPAFGPAVAAGVLPII